MQTMKEDDETTLALAASVAERAHELLRDGWVQGKLRERHDSRFCVHGAVYCALEEVFGAENVSRQTHTDGLRMSVPGPSRRVEAVVTAFLVQEAESQYGFVPTGMTDGIARFNDADGRTLEEVLSVVRASADRLWGLLEPEAPTYGWEDADESRPVFATA